LTQHRAGALRDLAAVQDIVNQQYRWNGPIRSFFFPSE
jgi:hypothetical protein